MYFVDRKKIALTLAHMNQLLNIIETKKDWQADEVSKLAFERIGQNIIESVIDVGNSMIDGFIMRDPGGYDDIIDILTDEKVITVEMDGPLKEVIEFRKVLVRQFYAVDHKQLEGILVKNLQYLKEFPKAVETYLIDELGPVSAFLPEDSNVKL
ncbi:DUF86 domain-containing protein [Psychrobacillus psychrodurans]|uniref:DUF86 domain-containing protein n=1 Tax=Psychrobacillus psychrodurans TaxID=126157 RepID=UPI0008F1744F|nr:DUF86 domain-containing protein [Psychrobacillus psychrodurans]MCZ8540388.1 DUF86 domain-containing protein [Psychrobacillus psychrodurans]SFM59182.1 Uncharacterized conserved protein YutE, UPF0331/DUF86 family [Psychrobacillus psychrodurans]